RHAHVRCSPREGGAFGCTSAARTGTKTEYAGAPTHDLSRAVAITAAIPDAIIAHHLHQHALAQPAIGNAQPPTREGASHGVEDGAAGEDKVGALGTNAGVGDTILIAPAQQPLNHGGHLDV